MIPRQLWLLLPLAAACTSDKDDSPASDSDEPPEALQWTPVLEEAEEGAFLAVWGLSGDDVWIVGGQPDAGVILRGSDQDWTPMALPAGTPLLNWVHGVAADDIWVAGIHGTLLHWDGGAWTDFSLEIEEAIWGVYALSSDDVVAVGGESGFGGSSGLILHWDGQSWTEQAIPSEYADIRNLFKVHHDGADWWVVGLGGAALRGPSADQLVAAPTGYAGDLVTASHPADGGPLIVVGGRGAGRVLEVEGDGLTVTAEAHAGLNGVAVLPDGRAIIAGEFGYTALYNSADDSVIDVRPITSDVLHGAWAFPGGMMYVVGGNLFTSDNFFHGVVLSGPTPE
ncbi:MAG: hypothetical protein H6741_28460 [Alphaproteobacteria bacterium]|nr:hypothetical protein [Alphaproteobacteria bacterium]MCB9796650.1 hypothetical protein [Alphaproteobacteria bacterium]